MSQKRRSDGWSWEHSVRSNLEGRRPPFQAPSGGGGMEHQGWLFIETKTGLDNSLWVFPDGDAE